MNKTLLLLLFLPLWCAAQTQQDSTQFRKISDEILLNGNAYKNLRTLTKDIGHRLSGSVGYDKATTWAQEKLKEAGAEKIWLQEVLVPVWVRGKESLKIKQPNGSWKSLKMLSLGNSEGTGGKDIEGEVIMVRSLEQFNQLPEAAIKGKIIFFNYPFRQDFIETFRGYGDAAKYRTTTASLVAKKGGKFVLIRSVGTGLDDVPHTGSIRYDSLYAKIPAVAIGSSTADALAQLIEKGKTILQLNSNCGMKQEKINHNIIGEISGKKDGKVIVVGAHLDSWDVGEGAHDDGTGIVQSIEVLRTLKQLNLQHNHTIRIVCYANEENGARGGEKYAAVAKEKNEPHLFAIESDAGGFSPRGLGLKMDTLKRKQIQSWAPLFLPYGVYDFSHEEGGVDINPLGRILGTPLSGLLPDSQRYFDLHHTAEDTFEKVNKRELLLGAIAMAQLVYMIDQNW